MTDAAVAEPDFPPLLHGVDVGAADPFKIAYAEAALEAEPGRIHYARAEDNLHAAITLVPEQPLVKAIGVLFAVQLGLIDALGALAPPGIAVHVQWPDRLRINGALCGLVRAAASTNDPLAEPDWLVIGLDLPILPRADTEPGEHPDQTCLFAEGCGELTAADLMETWSRHMLVWIHTFLTDGFPPLHENWCGKCGAIGTYITTPEAGHFVGLDELGGMILRMGEVTKLIPLTRILEAK